MSQYQQVYVPLIIYGREKYDYFAVSCGVYLKKKDALCAILANLIKENFIDYDDIITNPDNAEDTDELMMSSAIASGNFTETDFYDFLMKKMDGDIEKLKFICKHYGDSYYEDGWTFRIDEHNII
jgi:hypothetical protein